MAEQFHTRDVKNKEIYDSYMGILRISPNDINGSDVDDPTQLLNTLYDEYKKRRTNIILSDSDGNVLPIVFQPRAFQSKVLKRDKLSLIDTVKDVDVINVATIIGKDDGSDAEFTHSTLYVSNTMKCRSTLQIIRPENEGEADYRKSTLRILSGGQPSISTKKITGDGWLLYPTESPNDSNYFNDKNKCEMFDEDDTNTPRYEQVEKTLFEWGRKEHETNISEAERVIIGNRQINTLNQFNEEVPVYYTRDYILGHYDGHAMITEIAGNQIAENWGINGESDEGITENITKLSWTRIDKLIWDSLKEILNGKLRHVKGRYDCLGVNQSAAPGIIDKLALDDATHSYKEKAPILGTEVARGLVTYHAMPFHRYWFYRTRQALRNSIERRKMSITDVYKEYKESGNGKTLDEYIIKIKGIRGDSYAQGNTIAKEIDKLANYFDKGLLTPADMASVGFAHSLVKNFLLCNGRTVKFSNFPNISLTNEAIYDTGNFIGATAVFDTTNKTFAHKTLVEGSAEYALAQSSGGATIKLPNLFALYEKTPRFIRGLNWKNNLSDNNIVTIFNKLDGNSSYDYINENDFANLKLFKDKDFAISSKGFKSVNKLYFHTFDHLIEKEEHYHSLFSSVEGDTSGTLYTLLNKADCGNTRRGYPHHYGWRQGTFLNYDRTYSTLELFNNTGYRFLGGNANDNNAWSKYCMDLFNGENVYTGAKFCNFTPIPNMGLYLYNTSICNNTGTICGNSRGHNTGCFGFVDANGTEHWVSEAQISVTYEDCVNSTANTKKYDLEKERRKFFVKKLNEAEGFIPISWYGKASGKVQITYSRDERNGSKSSSRNTYDDHFYNIAGYKMAAPRKTSSKWRCLSSIPYLNPYKLGVGDIAKYIDNIKKNDETVDYYDINCVTQLPTEDKLKNYKFGGNIVQVDESCPTPAHMNLLPLIRI